MGPLLTSADRVWLGVAVVFRRTRGSLVEWVRGPEDRAVGDRALRLATLTGAGWVLWVGVTAAPVVMWGLAGWGLLSSWRAVSPPRVLRPKGSAPQAKPAAPAGAKPTPAAPAPPVFDGDRLIDLVDELIGDARGVHLSTVLDRLHAAGAHLDWGVKELGLAIEAAGVPTRASVGMGSGRDKVTRKGVHVDDLEAALAGGVGGSSGTPAGAPSGGSSEGPAGGPSGGAAEAPAGGSAGAVPAPSPTNSAGAPLEKVAGR
ncbi:hypothetical protein [Streptomyces sp. SM12]|uniref:hypothetical protein n=1 Tax=Streptomyces sp. SM12 TaxID=1071602 RepID=UPI000CD4CBF0|nr:hypothetical protein [Streptomyces sp. SM12]